MHACHTLLLFRRHSYRQLLQSRVRLRSLALRTDASRRASTPRNCATVPAKACFGPPLPIYSTGGHPKQAGAHGCANDTCGLRVHLGELRRLSRPTPQPLGEGWSQRARPRTARGTETAPALSNFGNKSEQQRAGRARPLGVRGAGLSFFLSFFLSLSLCRCATEPWCFALLHWMSGAAAGFLSNQ